MLFSSFLFFMLLSAIFVIEYGRVRDLLGIFLFIFVLQVVLPGVALPLLLYFGGNDLYLGNFFLDRVYARVDGWVVVLVALLAVVFTASVYVGYYVFPARCINTGRQIKNIIILKWRMLFVMAVGLLSMMFLLFRMPGDGVGERYFNLLLFRAQDPSIFGEFNNFITANLFALTQTFAILVTMVLFFFKNDAIKLSLWKICIFICLMLFMATFAVSRRILMIQLFIIYFAMVLYGGRWYFWRIACLFPFALIWLGFGSELVRQIPQYFSTDGHELSSSYANFLAPLLNGFSSLGITLNSSWATLMFLDDMPMRFGLDHVLSALRRLPLESLGVNENQIYGPRIVRVSTEAFVDGDALDIPPGLMGQMWLDFRIFGPIVWGLFFGVFIKIIQVIFDGFERTWISCGVFSIIIFFVALPLNSGSLDFNFSVDMIFLLVFIWFITKIKNPFLLSDRSR